MFGKDKIFIIFVLNRDTKLLVAIVRGSPRNRNFKHKIHSMYTVILIVYFGLYYIKHT